MFSANGFAEILKLAGRKMDQSRTLQFSCIAWLRTIRNTDKTLSTVVRRSKAFPLSGAARTL
jgi:hypothetical protein